MKPIPGPGAAMVGIAGYPAVGIACMPMVGATAVHTHSCILPSVPAEMNPEPSNVRNFTTYRISRGMGALSCAVMSPRRSMPGSW